MSDWSPLQRHLDGVERKGEEQGALRHSLFHRESTTREDRARQKLLQNTCSRLRMLTSPADVRDAQQVFLLSAGRLKVSVQKGRGNNDPRAWLEVLTPWFACMFTGGSAVTVFPVVTARRGWVITIMIQRRGRPERQAREPAPHSAWPLTYSIPRRKHQ